LQIWVFVLLYFSHVSSPWTRYPVLWFIVMHVANLDPYSVVQVRVPVLGQARTDFGFRTGIKTHTVVDCCLFNHLYSTCVYVIWRLFGYLIRLLKIVG
jgi:hypothetical protein